MTRAATDTTVSFPARGRAADYIELCKPRVVMVMIFTAVIGELLAQPGTLPLRALILGNLGIACRSAGLAEQAVEHEADDADVGAAPAPRGGGRRFRSAVASAPMSLRPDVGGDSVVTPAA